jgi:hypothetical protein
MFRENIWTQLIFKHKMHKKSHNLLTYTIALPDEHDDFRCSLSWLFNDATGIQII